MHRLLSEAAFFGAAHGVAGGIRLVDIALVAATEAIVFFIAGALRRVARATHAPAGKRVAGK